MSEFELYPEKPKLIEYQRRNNWSLTFFSMVLFVLLFSYIFIDKMNVILYLVGVLFLHELGHYIGMKKFDYRNVRMLFVPILGAFVHGKKDKYSQRETMLVVALGPIPGAIIGALCIYFSSSLGSPELFLLGVLFSALNVLNLLPIDPLDGGQLLKHLFNRNTELFLFIFSLLYHTSLRISTDYARKIKIHKDFSVFFDVSRETIRPLPYLLVCNQKCFT